MSTNLSASIQRLRESASKLNELTDQANLAVQVVERLLRDECKIGTAASVRLNASSKKNISSKNDVAVNALLNMNGTFLDYRKVGSSFRIAVVNMMVGSGENVTPWSDCPRDVKLETIRILPELVSKVVAEIDKRIHDAESALADVSEILNIETDHPNIKSKRVSVKSKRKRVSLGLGEPNIKYKGE